MVRDLKTEICIKYFSNSTYPVYNWTFCLYGYALLNTAISVVKYCHEIYLLKIWNYIRNSTKISP